MINNFRYRYYFLSNFTICRIPYNGMLLEAGNEELVEGNTWGVCKGKGRNELG